MKKRGWQKNLRKTQKAINSPFRKLAKTEDVFLNFILKKCIQIGYIQ
jgi:hypothetical protein